MKPPEADRRLDDLPIEPPRAPQAGCLPGPSISRRLVLQLPCLAAPVWTTGGASAHAAQSAGLVHAERIADGVHAVIGAIGEPEPGNLGRVGNAGFVVGERGVVAIDAGVSYRHGEALLTAIAAVTDQPVRLLILTHARQEFLFGATAFREQGVPIAMHRQAAALMKARCEGCLATLGKTLGAAEMAGSEMFEPDRVFDDGHVVEDAGRPLRVLYFGPSSGPGDIAVLEPTSGVVFAGGLVDVDRIPEVQDAQVPGWHRALASLESMRPSLVVPGHGPVAPASAIAQVDRYLSALEACEQRLLEADTPLSRVADETVLREFEGWSGYRTTHRRNAALVFLRLEHEYMLAGRPSPATER